MTLTEADLKVHRAQLRERVGDVWDTKELTEEFKVIAFQAPFVLVRDKKTNKEGTLEFQHRPRFYWGFEENE